MPETLSGWKMEARKLDEQRLRQEARNVSVKSAVLEREKDRYKPAVQTVKTVNPTTVDRKTATGTVFGGSGQPMDIDAAKRAGLCFHCGNWGHLNRNCPHKKPVQVRNLDIDSMSKEDIEGLIKQLTEKKEGF